MNEALDFDKFRYSKLAREYVEEWEEAEDKSTVEQAFISKHNLSGKELIITPYIVEAFKELGYEEIK